MSAGAPGIGCSRYLSGESWTSNDGSSYRETLGFKKLSFTEYGICLRKPMWNEDHHVLSGKGLKYLHMTKTPWGVLLKHKAQACFSLFGHARRRIRGSETHSEMIPVATPLHMAQ